MIEYKVINSDGAENLVIMERTLNQEGQDGWQLVCVIPNRAYVFSRDVEVPVDAEP